MAKISAGSGDDGTTGLLGGKRVPKYDLRPSTYGTVDEASAALGLAKSLAVSDRVRQTIDTVQAHLYHLMSELAAVPEAAEKYRWIDDTHVRWLEAQIEGLQNEVDMPRTFIVPGGSPASASLDLARTVVRRAERLTVQLLETDPAPNPSIVPYLNRLSTLCFLLSLWTLQAEGKDRPSFTRQERA